MFQWIAGVTLHDLKERQIGFVIRLLENKSKFPIG